MILRNPLQSFGRRLRHAYADRCQLEQRKAIAYGWVLFGTLVATTVLVARNALGFVDAPMPLGMLASGVASVLCLAVAVVLMLRGMFRSVADPLCWVMALLHIAGGVVACSQGAEQRFLSGYGIFVTITVLGCCIFNGMRTFLVVSLVEIAAIPLLPELFMPRDALDAYTKSYGALALNLAAVSLLVFGVGWMVRRIVDQALNQLEAELATNRAMKDELEAKVLERTAELSAARDAAEVANRAKGDFLANMSHEIRTPLHGMLGMVDLLLEAQMQSDAQEKLKVVSESGNHLMGIITDILEFSRIEEGKIEFHAEAIQLGPFLAGITESMALLAKSKGLELALWTAPDLPDCIEMDGLRLRQVLTNLIGNGIKFTHRGEVRLVAEVAEGRLRFQVQDTGEGMERSVLMHIFERFSQADSSITRRFGGTGLGLSISRSLTEGMHGTLEVFSEPGKGSCFVVTFPLTLRSPRDASASDSSSTERPEQGEFEGARILLVDDNPVNRRVVEGMLSKGGCMVTMAEQGRMALSMLARNRYDLVLMDCQMPVMDGFEAARMIRSWKDSLDEKLRSASGIPVIGLTADVSRQAREECLAAGMDSVLTKPFKATALREAIRAQLA